MTTNRLTQPTQAISYVRFSTTEQSKGDSYRRQTEATAEYCTRKGITLLDAEYFDSGVSAFKGKNEDEGALSQIINNAKKNLYPKGTILIVESLDRISRQEINKALRLFLEILECGLDIVTLSDGERHYKHDKTELVDLIVSLVVLSRAHEESEMKSQRVSAAWKGRRKLAKESGKIITGVCPSWLKVENEEFVTIPERVELVKKIFNHSIVDNMGGYKISTQLNLEGIQPWGNEKLNKSGLWSRGFVTALLSNVAVLGIHQPKKLIGGKLVQVGEAIMDYYPAIIDQETFNRHKAKTRDRKIHSSGRTSRMKDYNLFKGLVQCSKCGHQLHFVSKESENKEKMYCYLTCSGKCGAKPADYHLFEKIVLRSLPTVNFKDIDENNQQITARNEAREGMIITKKAELKTLKERWKKTNSETIMEMIEETELEISNIQKEMEEVQSIKDPKNTAERLKYIERRLEETDQSWRTPFRTTVTKLIKEITLDTETLETEINFISSSRVIGTMVKDKIKLVKDAS